MKKALISLFGWPSCALSPQFGKWSFTRNNSNDEFDWNSLNDKQVVTWDTQRHSIVSTLEMIKAKKSFKPIRTGWTEPFTRHLFNWQLPIFKRYHVNSISSFNLKNYDLKKKHIEISKNEDISTDIIVMKWMKRKK